MASSRRKGSGGQSRIKTKRVSKKKTQGASKAQSASKSRRSSGARPAPDSRQIIVLGMHRSGTSALTGALAQMGIHVGDDEELTPKNWENPVGFYERRDARKICDTLLHSSGADWWKVSSFHPDNAKFEAVQGQVPAMRDLVQRLDEHGSWALKEPRLCFLLPIFQRVLIKPLAIVALRHPVEIARSLRRRNGFTVQAGLALWEAYTVSLLRSALGMDHIFVRYEDLVTDPAACLGTVAEELGARGVFRLNVAGGAASIQPALHREHYDDADRGLLSSSQLALWNRLTADSAIESVPKLSDAALAVLREFEADETARLESLRSIQALNQKISTLEAAAGEHTGKAKEAAQQLNERATALAEAQKDLAATKSAETALRQQHAAKDARIAEAQAEIEKLSAASRNQVEQLAAAGRQVDELRGELAARDSRLSEAQGTLAELRARIAAQNERLSAESRQTDQLRGELTARDSRASEAQATLSELRSRHAEQSERLAGESRLVEKLRGELDSSQSKLRDERAALAEIRGRYTEQGDRLSSQLEQIDRLQDEVAERDSKIRALQGQLKELETQHAKQSEQLLIERDSTISVLKGELEALKDQSAEQHELLVRSELAARNADSRASEAQAALSELRSRHREQSERLAAESRLVEELRGELETLEWQRSEHKALLRSSEKQAQELREAVTERNTRIAELAGTLDQVQRQSAEQSRRTVDDERHADELRSEIESRDKRIRELVAQLDSGQSTRDRLDAELASKLSEIKGRDSRLSELQSALTLLQGEADELRDRLRDTDRRLHEARNRGDALEAKSQRQSDRSRRQHERAASLRTSVQSLTAEKDAIEARLSAIESSRSWRMVSAIGRLRQRIGLSGEAPAPDTALERPDSNGSESQAKEAELVPAATQAQETPAKTAADHPSEQAAQVAQPMPAAPPQNQATAQPVPRAEPASLGQPAYGDQVETSVRLGDDGHHTSIVVLNRDGERHLKNLFQSYLKHHDAQAAEWVIVDHASKDASLEVIRGFMAELPIKLIVRDFNDTFSRSNNLAVQYTNGKNLVFCNNDIIFDRPTIGALAGELVDAEVGIVSLPLYYPQADAGTERSLQHAGIGFRYDDQFDFPRPFNIQRLTAEGKNLEFPAVTAALMACRSEDFLAIGGFNEGYDYGYEDVDLSLTFRKKLGKSIVLCGKVSAIHDESASQKKEASDAVAKRRRGNIALFRSRYSDVVLRDYLQPSTWGTERASSFRLGLVVTDDDPNTTAGDFFTASELAQALEAECGWTCSYLSRRSKTQDWYDCSGLDGVLVLIDAYDLRLIEKASPNLVKIAWLRNWFDRWVKHPWFNRYDLALCSSVQAADFITKHSAVKVDTLRIATNPDTFQSNNPEDPAFASDYCFTGSYWNARREIEDLDPRTLPYKFGLFGAGWENHEQFSDCRRGPIPYREIPKVYANTKIVIDDANHVTRPWGSVNSRVFDALASGALVISNGTRGARETFDGLLPTWDNTEELVAQLRYYMEHPEERAHLARMLQANVKAEHTYARRAQQLKGVIEHFGEQPRVAIKLPVPKWNVANEWGDFHFGSALARSLEKLGYRVRMDVLSEWYDAGTEADDAVIVLRGLSRYDVRPDQLSLMWNISHSDKVSDEEYEQYDHVFIASLAHAAELDARLRCPVSPLLQCTDPERFRFDPELGRNDHVLFVGNSRNVRRPIVQHAIDAGIDLKVYGTRWETLIDERFIAGQHIDNAELAAAYAGSGAVLNDHWETMRESGFISNRLFDLAACGAVIVTDRVAGATTVFGDTIYEYDDSPESLKLCIEKALAEGADQVEARRDLSLRVAREHSFDSRAQTIHLLIEQKLAGQAPARRDAA